MSFLDNLIEVMNIRSEASLNKALGIKGDDAMLFAVLSQRRRQRQSSISKEEYDRIAAWLEEDKKNLAESKAALAERQRKLFEENLWLADSKNTPPDKK